MQSKKAIREYQTLIVNEEKLKACPIKHCSISNRTCILGEIYEQKNELIAMHMGFMLVKRGR